MREIERIVKELTSLAIEKKSPFLNIQHVRSENRNRKSGTYKPFSKKSIKENYAFHAGGRKELQFNLGEDQINNQIIFRYGIAISLNEDKSLHNSKAEFRNQILRLNNLVEGKYHLFKDLSMWYYSNNKFQQYFDKVRVIDDKLFRTENFIFIGKYINKPLGEVNRTDLDHVLSLFDSLMPIYEEVQFGENTTDTRWARITYNTNGWVYPSGRYGKSNDIKTHEGQYGYGHEEWLFDISKLINGYHYSFLKPIRKEQATHEGNSYEVHLYTIDSVSRKRYLIGNIKNLEVISNDHANDVKAIYEKKGWYKEMKHQLHAVETDWSDFQENRNIDLFNIRFKPIDLDLYDPYLIADNEHYIYSIDRYTFAQFTTIKTKDNDKGFTFKPGRSSNLSKGTKSFTRGPRKVEIRQLHNEISEKLFDYLVDEYGENHVSQENSTGTGGTRIDMVVKSSSGYIFYEIKTYPCIKACIREAIGQLLEYAYWPEYDLAEKLVIVSQRLEDNSSAYAYMRHIRKLTKLPIYYQYFDLESSTLSKEN